MCGSAADSEPCNARPLSFAHNFSARSLLSLVLPYRLTEMVRPALGALLRAARAVVLTSPLPLNAGPRCEARRKEGGGALDQGGQPHARDCCGQARAEHQRGAVWRQADVCVTRAGAADGPKAVLGARCVHGVGARRLLRGFRCGERAARAAVGAPPQHGRHVFYPRGCSRSLAWRASCAGLLTHKFPPLFGSPLLLAARYTVRQFSVRRNETISAYVTVSASLGRQDAPHAAAAPSALRACGCSEHVYDSGRPRRQSSKLATYFPRPRLCHHPRLGRRSQCL